jgi:hypothetical protein
MTVRLRHVIVVLLSLTMLPVCAGAQQILDEDAAQARMRIGPFAVAPSIALTKLGVDTNVFNNYDDPKSDLTFTLSPQADTWLRAGRSRLFVSARTDLVYFQQYTSERSIDGDVDARFEVHGARLTPWIAGSYVSGRQRIGYDADLRFRRVVNDASAGLDARVGGRLRVGVSAQRTIYRHDLDAFFGGYSLRDLLNRTTDLFAVQTRYALTPLTTFVVSAQTSRDRFEIDTSRNADSLRVESGFELSPFALISGRGRVGYRTFTGVGGALARYSGVVASVAAGSTVAGRTRIDVGVDRDVNYSWEFLYPYYVLTGVDLSVTPRLTQRWDVQLRSGLHHLAYRASEGVADLLQHRVDTHAAVGAGIGYHVGRDLRLGLNVDRDRRTSPVLVRAYEGYRTGISVTYGR